MTLKNIF